MKNAGKKFEEDWKKSIPEEMYYQRIKDSPNMFYKEDNNPNLRFTPKQPFDSFLFYSPNLFCWELKSTKGTSISFEGKSPMIKEHQIEELTNASEYKDIIAGFIMNFREPENKVFFLSIQNFNKFLSETTKKSINIQDIIKHGGIEVEGRLKRVRYKYNIKKFIKEIQGNNIEGETDE